MATFSLNLAEAELDLGRFNEAGERLGTCDALVERAADPRLRCFLVCMHARHRRRIGRLDEARTLLAQGESLAEAQGPVATVIWACERGHQALADGDDPEPYLKLGREAAAGGAMKPPVLERFERAAGARANGVFLRYGDLPADVGADVN